MNKIILKDGTEFNIEIGATDNCLAVITDDLTVIDTLVKSLTKENLTSAEIVDENNAVVLTLRNKYLAEFDGIDVKGEDGKYIVCFRLDDVYTIEERLAMLEASQEIHVWHDSGEGWTSGGEAYLTREKVYV